MVMGAAGGWLMAGRREHITETCYISAWVKRRRARRELRSRRRCRRRRRRRRWRVAVRLIQLCKHTPPSVSPTRRGATPFDYATNWPITGFLKNPLLLNLGSDEHRS